MGSAKIAVMTRWKMAIPNLEGVEALRAALLWTLVDDYALLNRESGKVGEQISSVVVDRLQTINRKDLEADLSSAWFSEFCKRWGLSVEAFSLFVRTNTIIFRDRGDRYETVPMFEPDGKPVKEWKALTNKKNRHKEAFNAW
jgi:hypothetical protein